MNQTIPLRLHYHHPSSSSIYTPSLPSSHQTVSRGLNNAFPAPTVRPNGYFSEQYVVGMETLQANASQLADLKGVNPGPDHYSFLTPPATTAHNPFDTFPHSSSQHSHPVHRSKQPSCQPYAYAHPSVHFDVDSSQPGNSTHRYSAGPSESSLSSELVKPKQAAENDLPPDGVNEVPLYVNAKQYHRILKRRIARQRLEELNRLSTSRKPYLHESRHRHACSRPRGKGGRFLTADEVEALKRDEAVPEASRVNKERHEHGVMKDPIQRVANIERQ